MYKPQAKNTWVISQFHIVNYIVIDLNFIIDLKSNKNEPIEHLNEIEFS